MGVWRPPCSKNEEVVENVAVGSWLKLATSWLTLWRAPWWKPQVQKLQNLDFQLVFLHFFKQGLGKTKKLKTKQNANITQENNNKNLINMCESSQICSAVQCYQILPHLDLFLSSSKNSVQLSKEKQYYQTIWAKRASKFKAGCNDRYQPGEPRVS